MIASIRLKLRKSVCSEKECNLYFQVIYRRKVKQIRTKYYIRQNEWNEKQMTVRLEAAVRPRLDYLYSVRQRIETEYENLSDIVRVLEGTADCSAELIVETYLSKCSCTSLVRFTRKEIARAQRDGRFKTSQSYECALRSFLRFRNGEDISWQGLSYTLVKEYERYLKRRSLSPNTISFYLRILRLLYNRAVREGITAHTSPFRGIHTRIERTEKRAAEPSVLRRLAGLDLSASPSLAMSRDLFLFSFYARGMSFVDMTYLRKDCVRDGFLVYYRRKTGQRIAIRLESCLQDIIRRYENITKDSPYLLPIFSLSNARPIEIQHRNAILLQNLRLRRISSLLKLRKPLTTYVSRHSWATIAKRSRIPIAIISEGMGHESEHTTQIYLDTLDSSLIDRANRTVISVLGNPH